MCYTNDEVQMLVKTALQSCCAMLLGRMACLHVLWLELLQAGKHVINIPHLLEAPQAQVGGMLIDPQVCVLQLPCQGFLHPFKVGIVDLHSNGPCGSRWDYDAIIGQCPIYRAD